MRYFIGWAMIKLFFDYRSVQYIWQNSYRKPANVRFQSVFLCSVFHLKFNIILTEKDDSYQTKVKVLNVHKF